MVSKAKVDLASDYLAMNYKKTKYNIEVPLEGKYQWANKKWLYTWNQKSYRLEILRKWTSLC